VVRATKQPPPTTTFPQEIFLSTYPGIAMHGLERARPRCERAVRGGVGERGAGLEAVVQAREARFVSA